MAKKEQRWIEERWKKLADECIRVFPELQPLQNVNCKITYLSSDKAYTKNHMMVHAQTEKIPDKYRWCLDSDFVIVFYEPNIEYMTDDQLIILMRHELNHIGYDSQDGDDVCYIIPHDVEDFSHILKTYGIDWSENHE